MTIWELDFYSRPLLDENKKKLWEVLIYESPQNTSKDPESLFRYAQFLPSNQVNSQGLAEAIEKAIATAPSPPKKIRFFRRQMNNMIIKACEDMGILALPSRRTYFVEAWLKQRLEEFYPQQPEYDTSAAASTSVKYPALNAIGLPDAIRGDKTDKWAIVSVSAADLAQMNEWTIDFSEAFPLSMVDITPEMSIPGLIIFSPRAIALAAWMSGFELSFLNLDLGLQPKIILETGVSDSWILVNLTNPSLVSQGKNFLEAKEKVRGVHFLAIQSSPESESFAGFWLLKDNY